MFNLKIIFNPYTGMSACDAIDTCAINANCLLYA